MSLVIEGTCGFRAAAKVAAAEVASAGEMKAFRDGTRENLPNFEPYVSAPVVRVPSIRKGGYCELPSALERRRLAAIAAQEAAPERVEPATARDIKKRVSFERIRCAKQSVEGRLTGTMKRYREVHYEQVSQLEKQLLGSSAA
jgi:hypothetical protein